MRTISFVVIIGAMLIVSPILAGGGVGNGGYIIMCPSQKKSDKKIVLGVLDFYESCELREICKELGPIGFSVAEKIDLAISRLNRLDPVRAARYMDHIVSFESEAIFKKGIELTNMNDTFHLFLPSGCVIRQVITQIVPHYPEDHRYIVSFDLWERLNNDDIAGLILHEVILREAKELGQTDSRAARYLNGLISSDYFETLSQEGYLMRLKLMGFPITENSFFWR